MSGWATCSDQKSGAGAWVICDATGTELSSGLGGLAEMIAALDEKLVMFGAIRVLGEDKQENVVSQRPKICRINWVGSKVPAMKKMSALSGKAKVAEIWNGTACEFDANLQSEITMNAIAVTLLASGGAHKPTQYTFGPGDEFILLADVKNKA